MTSISQSNRYLPHELLTKFYAVKLFKQGYSFSFVCRRYKISKSSLMRWSKRFNGTKESLIDKSHKPLTPHPNAHTEEELKWIRDYIRRNPHISLPELYGKLRVEKGYSRHACSLFRVLRKMNYYVNKEKHKAYVPKHYDTPTNIGVKCQIDFKYVPAECYSGLIKDRFYQYTIIDEASRERFIYPYKEQSSYSTVDFVKRAIIYFGYKPTIIQTDNGHEFTHTAKTNKIHPLNILCSELNITHKLIRPRTPRHNGKVERSHRNDQQRFYQYLSFYSYTDLIIQMKAYLKRSNNIPMQTLNWLTPIQKREQIKKQYN
jgi:transposase InsO family protein